MHDLEFELYRKLVDESARIREKAGTLSLQKLTLLGAMIAFILIRYETITKLDPGVSHFVVVGAMLAVVGVTLIMDIKLFEHAMHARAISHFIIAEYSDVKLLPEWERVLWTRRPSVPFANLYSVAFSVSTTAPTLLLVLLVGAVLGVLYDAPWMGVAIATLMSIIYAACASFTYYKLYAMNAV